MECQRSAQITQWPDNRHAGRKDAAVSLEKLVLIIQIETDVKSRWVYRPLPLRHGAECERETILIEEDGEPIIPAEYAPEPEMLLEECACTRDVCHGQVDVVEFHGSLLQALMCGLLEATSRGSLTAHAPTSPSVVRHACRGSPSVGCRDLARVVLREEPGLPYRLALFRRSDVSQPSQCRQTASLMQLLRHRPYVATASKPSC